MAEVLTRTQEAAKLEAQAKQLRRAEQAFWDEVAKRTEEVKARLGESDKFDEICRTYGVESEADREALLKHIMSERQVENYKRLGHGPAIGSTSPF